MIPMSFTKVRGKVLKNSKKCPNMKIDHTYTNEDDFDNAWHLSILSSVPDKAFETGSLTKHEIDEKPRKEHTDKSSKW